MVEIRGAADAGFTHTAAALAALDDPHLVPILGHGEHNGRRYLVAALPDGIRLPALTGVSALSAARAVAAVEDIAAALEVLRANGIGDVHLLPTDVWLAPGVSGAIVRLLPFGAFPGRPDPRYTAPERLRGKQFDERADVYALACLLFECLTGRPPYPGATAEAVITGHLRKSATAPDRRARGAGRRGAPRAGQEARGAHRHAPHVGRVGPGGARRATRGGSRLRR